MGAEQNHYPSLIEENILFKVEINLLFEYFLNKKIKNLIKTLKLYVLLYIFLKRNLILFSKSSFLISSKYLLYRNRSQIISINKNDT